MITRRDMIERVHTYFAASNEVSRAKFERVLAPDAVHYLPIGQGAPIRGIDEVVERWGASVATNKRRWAVDTVSADETAGTATCEWTAIDPTLGTVQRGVELYEFDEAGLIREIRIYYASPWDRREPVNELDGFPYDRGPYWHGSP